MADKADNEQRRPAANAADHGSTPPDRPTQSSTVIQPDGHIAAETLSAWLDNPADLAPEDRRTVQAHLDACPECSRTLTELRAIVATMNALPEIVPARSFALGAGAARATTPRRTAAPVPAGAPAAREPVVLQESRPWLERQMQALRWATAVAVILFVFVVSVDLIGSGAGSDADSASQAESAAVDQRTVSGGGAAATEAAPASDDETGDESTTMMRAPEGEEAQEGSGAAAEATPATGDEAAATGGETADAAAEAEPTATTAAAQAEAYATDDDQAATTEQVTAREREPSESARRIRILQVGLALVVTWLLTAMIALPRIRQRRQE